MNDRVSHETERPSTPARASERPRRAVPVAMGALAIVGALFLVALALNQVGRGGTDPSSYETWLADVSRSPLAALRWFIGDMTEPQFYKSDLASIGLLLGGFAAWGADRARRRWSGSPIAYGTGLWPWVLFSAALSLALANLMFRLVPFDDWQPTFIPFVSVAPALVLTYGGRLPVAVTAAILGSFTAPLAALLAAVVTSPLGLPVVVANVGAMTLGTAAAFLAARKMSWMKLSTPTKRPSNVRERPRTPTLWDDATWAFRRVLSDFTEPQFWANEWASLGLLAGVVLAYLIEPGLPAYGSHLLPSILVAQGLTSAIGVFVWRRWYEGDGWAPTYVPLASVAPAAVLALNGSLLGIIGGALLGALIGPPIARWISAKLPKEFHPVIGNTFAMAVSTAAIVPALQALSTLPVFR